MDEREDEDLRKIITEQPSRYQNLEKMSVRELVEGINREDGLVHKAVRKALPQIERLIGEILPRMEQGGRVFYIGSGTSGRLGVLDASELPPTFGVPGNMVIGLISGGDVALRKAVEKAEDDPEQAWEDMKRFEINRHDTVIGIAASGTTPYVVGGLQRARHEGLLTGCITCNPGSPVTEAAEIAVEAVVGPEFLTGSTRMKAGTAQKMILNMITTSLMIKLGKVKGNRMINMQLTNNKLVRRGTRMIMEEINLDADQARDLLLKHGSVRLAIEAWNRENG
ncbi:MAG: N-acetylmuramic acid 6-phosphate etherase [Marinilabiliales bacterium]|nr:MAG: N-acetylmuramic acid 6-phosphate etherase [Marinilabiliales bacterium]